MVLHRTCLPVSVFVAALLVAMAGNPSAFGENTRNDPTSSPRTVRVVVVDAHQNPVEGATISPNGLVTPHTYFDWAPEHDGRRYSVKTGSDGAAILHVPEYESYHVPPVAISFRIDHPSYVPHREWRYPLDGTGKPVVLEAGVSMRITAYTDSVDHLVDGFFPFVGGEGLYMHWNNWTWRKGKVLETVRYPTGPACLRLAWVPEKGPTRFSDVVCPSVKKGAVSSLCLKLKPGVRVSGKLEKAVPRPVRNGWVIVKVVTAEETPGNQYLVWGTWAPVSADGTFVFDSLPPGQLQAVALCDGYVSKNPEGSADVNTRDPQVLSIDGEAASITLAMERAASCEVTVLDPTGRPIQGARVRFSPNVHWNRIGKSILGERPPRPEEVMRSGEEPDPFAYYRNNKDLPFSATTDAKGVATVRSLPGFTQYVAVSSDGYEVPPDTSGSPLLRNVPVSLIPGETSSVTVRLAEKGVRDAGDKSHR